MPYITLPEHNKVYSLQNPRVQSTLSQTDVTNLTKQIQNISWENPTTFSPTFSTASVASVEAYISMISGNSIIASSLIKA